MQAQVGGAEAGGGGGGGWDGQLRARVCNAAAAAVEVHSAVEFAAAMQAIVSGWTKYKNRITVDPEAACVSYQQDDKCIIFSVGGGPRVQFVNIEGLPPSFIDVRRAQEVQSKWVGAKGHSLLAGVSTDGFLVVHSDQVSGRWLPALLLTAMVAVLNQWLR